MLEKIAYAYFKALKTQDGALAGSLFADQGVIDDFKGRRHRGGALIAGFIGSRPPLDVELIGELETDDNRVMVFGRITYGSGEKVLVRWVFTMDDGRIVHVCNSRVEKTALEWAQEQSSGR